MNKNIKIAMVINTNSLFIHIIDDDESVRQGLSRLLRSVGLASCTYASAQAFLELEHHEPNACILMDITMPVVSGLEFARRLKKASNQIPVIALSARDDEETRKLVKELGVQFFLRKPVDDQALIDAINWVMRSSKTSTGSGLL